VLNPAKTEDLYFVANGTGGHSFASSLEEHAKNAAATARFGAACRQARCGASSQARRGGRLQNGAVRGP
jgi:UPF0755 protein